MIALELEIELLGALCSKKVADDRADRRTGGQADRRTDRQADGRHQNELFQDV